MSSPTTSRLNDPATPAQRPAGQIEPPAALPSEGVRGVLSLLLFIHLFSLCLVVLPGRIDPLLSQLQFQLRAPLSPYLQFLNLDPLGLYDHWRLTQGSAFDVDHYFQVELNLPDGRVETIELPPQGLAPNERLRHYQMLALAAGVFAESNVQESNLPLGVAQGLVTRHEATGGTIRVRRHLLPDRDAYGRYLEGGSQAEDLNAPNYWQTVYEARILVTGGAVSLLRSEAGSESAPGAMLPGASP